jgi:hypothetical protein
MKDITPDFPLESLVSTVSEDDLRDVEFCKELIRRAFEIGAKQTITLLFEKMSRAFIFADAKYRQELIEDTYSAMRPLELADSIEIGRYSVFGNVVVLYSFMKRYTVVTSERLELVAALSELSFIKDPFTLELLPSGGKLILEIDERAKQLNKPPEIEKSIEICELLFMGEKIVESRDTVEAMLRLYEASQMPDRKFKADILSSLLLKNPQIFLYCMQKMGKAFRDEQDIIHSYSEIFDLLQSLSLPVFFDFARVRFTDKVYNDNSYFARLLRKSGIEELLWAFEDEDSGDIQKVYDLRTEGFVTPKGRSGKVLLHEVFSFKKAQEITDVSTEKIMAVKTLYETEIEEKIRDILRDQNITAHSPAEKVDVLEWKSYINNERDLRNVGFILKGRGFPKLSLDKVAHNIVKAVDLPVDIVFLVFTGDIFDEALAQFINLTTMAKKMYCVIDSRDLARLLVAYGKL